MTHPPNQLTLSSVPLEKILFWGLSIFSHLSPYLSPLLGKSPHLGVTTQETDRLLGQQYNDDTGYYDTVKVS